MHLDKDCIEMTKHTSLAIALTATTFLCTPAVASSLTPTLDALKSEAGSVLPSVNQTYNLSELSGDLPTGAVKVEIGGKDYYFMPSGDNAGLLTTLAGTSAGMLKESSDGLFELDGVKYGFDVASIPDSAFSYSEGSEDDYNFTMSEADAEGKLTTQYYKIDLKPEAFATSKNISWTAVSEDQKDAADVVAVQLPNDQTKYFKYTYTQPEGRTVYNTRQEALSGDVDADFVNINSAPNYAGAIYNTGSAVIEKITGNFINNCAEWQAGVINNLGIIGNITGDFVNNYLQTEDDSNQGGAIFNGNTIENIAGNFIGNHASSGFDLANGGAIYNRNKIGNITGDFIANYTSSYQIANGGAFLNVGTIGNITGDFIGNYASGDSTKGGAIYNGGTIGNITGDFIGNYAKGELSKIYGGAIYNTGTIGDITGNFIGNFAFYTAGEPGNVKGNFISNYIELTQSVAYGGAVYAGGTVGNITGDFIQNHAEGEWAAGGAIYNNGTIGDIAGDFIGNYVSAMKDGASNAAGGAIYNDASIDNISGNFLNNYAQTISMYYSLGGAVYTSRDMTFNSDADVHFMSGNYVQDGKHSKIYNALFVETADTPTITFNTANNGAWVINDTIEGGQFAGPSINYNDQYGLLFNGNDTIDADTGTTTQYIAMNNDIVNAGTVTVSGTSLRFGAYQHEDQTAKNWDGKGAFVASLNADGTANRDAAAVTVLSLNNAVFDLANGYQDVVKLKGYSATDSFLHIDVDVENMKADMLNVNGNVEGGTKLIVHASSDADIRGKGEILFAESENDTTGNAGSFVVSRVYKSPYLFDINYTQRAENSNQWGLTMNDQNNPDKYVEPEEPDVPDVPTPELPDIPVKPTPSVDYRKVAPEVIAYQGLPAAALEQTKGMVGNVSGQITRTDADHTLWANAVYRTSENEALVNVDADVWGIEAGGDLQHDLNNKLGLFLSYRKGNYDMSGDGKHHYSTVGSQIDIDSYLAGLYYRYDRNHWWTFATVYGGIQSVDLKTKDGIKSDTDGTEFGGSVELGYDYAINKTLYLTPSVGAFYTQVDYDDATDSAGKIAKYNTLRQLELEAGVKLTKAFVMDEGYANVYVKPSVVRTITDGDEVKITGLGKVNTLDDQTLGRVEIGGRYGFTEQLSAYGWANHTFGDDYKASTFGLGLSYNW